MKRTSLLFAALVVVTAAPLVAVTFPSDRGSWFRTANDVTGERRAAEATLLADGRVALIGGNTAVIDLFDPTTNTFTAGPNDTKTRIEHTATRLGDGRVLIAGGVHITGSVEASASLFDPAGAGSVTATGSMATTRREHTATLLANGKVLVAGGRPALNNPRTTSIEIYDPAAGSWSSGGTLQEARALHTATLLPNGKVLIVGGSTITPSTTEVYDPATMTTTMVTIGSRYETEHTAILANDGKVYLFGGSVSIPGGGGSTHDRVHVFDPATNTFTLLSQRLPAEREYSVAGLMADGKILLAAGDDGISGNETGKACVLFNPATGRGVLTASLHVARRTPASAMLQDGRFLVIASDSSNGVPEAFTTAEFFDPATLGNPRGDIDGDLKADVLWHHPATGRNVLWRMNGLSASGVGLPAFAYGSAGLSWQLEQLFDLSGDGKMDIRWRETTQATPLLRYALGPAPTGPASESFGAQHLEWSVVAAADFSGDGREDLVWRRTTGEVQISLISPGGGGFFIAGQNIITLPADWIIAAADDFDGDTRADILWRNLTTGENYIWFMDGFTVERAGHTLNVTDMNYSVAGSGDFDGNGKADLIWRSATGDTRFWFMDGVTVTNGVPVPAQGAGWDVAVVGDFDRDGKSDIFWRNPTTGDNAVILYDGFNLKAASSLGSVSEAGWTTPKY